MLYPNNQPATYRLVAEAKRYAAEPKTDSEIRRRRLESVLTKPQGPTTEEVEAAYAEFRA